MVIVGDREGHRCGHGHGWRQRTVLLIVVVVVGDREGHRHGHGHGRRQRTALLIVVVVSETGMVALGWFNKEFDRKKVDALTNVAPSS